MKLKKIILISLGMLFIGSIGMGWYVYRWESRDPVLEVYFFHLNRGHSVFLRTPHGKTILIDGGQNGEVIRELTKVFPFYRRRINTVIVTSAEPRNVGGLSEVLERYEVEKVIEPILFGTSTAQEVFHRTVKKKGITIEKVEKGDGFEVDEVKFEVLFPDPNFKYNKSSVPELLFRVSIATTSMVFLGGSSKTIQKSLSAEIGKVHLVEFAHGATKSRVSADLLLVLNPEVIVSSKREGTLRFQFR